MMKPERQNIVEAMTKGMCIASSPLSFFSPDVTHMKSNQNAGMINAGS